MKQMYKVYPQTKGRGKSRAFRVCGWEKVQKTIKNTENQHFSTFLQQKCPTPDRPPLETKVLTEGGDFAHTPPTETCDVHLDS